MTNLQFLSEFCHFSHFNDKRQTNMTFLINEKAQTKVRNSIMLILVCLTEFWVYK